MGKAIEVLGQRALAQDEKTRDELLVAAQGTPEFQAAARTAAARIAVKERIKLRLYQPFARMIGVSKAYFEDVFPDEMAARTAHIPDEHMVTPPASVAVPAMQGLSYSFEEADLRELYLNLLTTATDDRRSESAHPAFAEVIKQLSARETTLLNATLSRLSVPAARLDDRADSGGYRVLLSHLIDVRDVLTNEPIEAPLAPLWIDNWERLGLIDVSYQSHLVDEKQYEWVVKRPEYIQFSRAIGVRKLVHTKGMISRTSFGERFIQAVSPPPGFVRPSTVEDAGGHVTLH
ncbi:hypothetical protein MED15_03754 [Micromonospora noduli]|uniref:DUF4393 domain-containing protein n=1 Tax=Micromonospora noduli TaxID=709876 RepID=A0ABX9D083_9ACTN|nr:hypothetical protein MED15_03754 [Micromonospora noduli]